MGSSQSQLTAEELRDYRELTFLTKKEILHAFKRFKGIAVGEVLADKHARIPVKYIEQMPEFKCNPFRDRLLRVFSSCKDERMSFEDFLDLLSVLCEDAPVDVKAEYAFQIFDMDDDGVLGEDDLAEVIKRLTSWDSGCRLETPDVQRLIEQVLAEADLDRSGHMSLMEFQHCMLKNPDFARFSVETGVLVSPAMLLQQGKWQSSFSLRL
uniref:Calcium and integrin-binding protein 1 n=1 Tax=Rhipicephalus appendiculatus TaxID=34631 RepID=A0A131YQK2_RHIAP